MSWKREEHLKWNKKFCMSFKGFSVAKYYLRLESAPLNPQLFCKLAPKKHPLVKWTAKYVFFKETSIKIAALGIWCTTPVSLCFNLMIYSLRFRRDVIWKMLLWILCFLFWSYTAKKMLQFFGSIFYRWRYWQHHSNDSGRSGISIFLPRSRYEWKKL